MNTNKRKQKKMSLQQINKITRKRMLKKPKLHNQNPLRFNTSQKNTIYGKPIANMSVNLTLATLINRQPINIGEKKKFLMNKIRKRILGYINKIGAKSRSNKKNMTILDKQIKAHRISKMLDLISINPKKNSHKILGKEMNM